MQFCRFLSSILTAAVHWRIHESTKAKKTDDEHVCSVTESEKGLRLISSLCGRSLRLEGETTMNTWSGWRDVLHSNPHPAGKSSKGGNRSCWPGGHHCNYYPGDLSLSQFTASHLRVKSKGAQYLNELWSLPESLNTTGYIQLFWGVWLLKEVLKYVW